MTVRPRGGGRWPLLLALAWCTLSAGCGTWFDRTAYDTLTGYQRQRSPCVAPVPSDCPKTPTYDQYRRARDADRPNRTPAGASEGEAADSP